MGMSLETLKELFDANDVKYFVAPDHPALLAGFRGFNGTYQILTVLELDGAFLQFRTMGWPHCPSDHPALTEVLKAISDENYSRRMVKFGWDHRDGELVASADVWIEDGILTKAQFSRMLSVFLPVIDMAYARITKTLETGTDPGAMNIEDMLPSRQPGGGSLSDKVRILLDEIRKGGKGSGDTGAASEPGSEPEDKAGSEPEGEYV